MIIGLVQYKLQAKGQQYIWLHKVFVISVQKLIAGFICFGVIHIL